MTASTVTLITAAVNLDATEPMTLSLSELATRYEAALRAHYPTARIEITEMQSTGYTPDVAAWVQDEEAGEIPADDAVHFHVQQVLRDAWGGAAEAYAR